MKMGQVEKNLADTFAPRRTVEETAVEGLLGAPHTPLVTVTPDEVRGPSPARVGVCPQRPVAGEAGSAASPSARFLKLLSPFSATFGPVHSHHVDVPLI